MISQDWKQLVAVLCITKTFENPESNDAWEHRLGLIKSSQNYRNFGRIDGEPTEFEWNIFPGFNTVQLSEEVNRFSKQIGRNTTNFHRKNSINVNGQRHLLWNKRQWRRMSGKCSTRIFVCKKIWKKDRGHSLVRVLRKMVLYHWRQSTRNLGQNCRRDVVRIRWERMSNFPCYDSIV